MMLYILYPNDDGPTDGIGIGYKNISPREFFFWWRAKLKRNKLVLSRLI